MFYLLLPVARAARRRFIAHLKARGILGVFHYLPLHLSAHGPAASAAAPGDCPVTEDAADRLLRLPFYNDLTEADQGEVIAAVREFRV